uniref:Transposase (Putative), gypsy type n=1 Tax=Tanacetum cinerariifolium TaxID=118510 RepID=A0A699I9S1_TANCI|nr:hypothetical protein [Tanacetum cinerariifolium]
MVRWRNGGGGREDRKTVKVMGCFGTSVYPCVLRDYLSLHDVPLPLLGEMWKAFSAFCEKFHIPEEVHHVLPNRDNKIHERPVGKIELYTRLFDFANFRLPLSTFLVDILSRHYTLDEDIYPSFVDKDGEDMDIFAFIHTLDPTKVKVFERERQEDEPRLLETTVSPTVPLLLVAPDRGESELEASINIQPIAETMDIAAEDVVPLQPRHQKKRKTVVAGAGEPSHPPKKLREDHGTLSRASIGGKSRSAVQRLLVGAMHNAKVRGDPIPTLPFVTSSVSATPERKGEGHTDSVTILNLQTISAPQRFVISLDSSHHSDANIVEAKVDSFARPSVPVITAATTVTSTANPAIVIKEKIVKPSLFAVDSALAGGTDPAMGCFMDLSGSDFLVGDDGRVFREMVDEFSPSKFFASIYEMEHGQLFTEFNVGAVRQMSLSAELLKSRDEEIKNLKAQLLLKEAKAAKAIRLRAEASHFEVTEKSLRDEVNALNGRDTILEKERNALDVKVTDLEATVASKERELTDSAQLTCIKSQNDDVTDQVHELQDAQLKVVNEKFNKFYTDFVEVALHLKERFYPHLLTTIAGRRWLLTHGMELAIAKCLNSPEYLLALGTAVSKAIEKGMQDGLAVGITHGREGRALTDVAAHNPFVEVNYVSAVQQLQSVNFILLAKLKKNKDVSIEALMNFLHIEKHLAERLGLNESQPHADKLMVSIHHSPDKTVVGASALSLVLDVSDARVRRIRENIMSHRSLLQDVFIPLVGPLSVAALTGMEGTSDAVSATGDITTTFFVTLASSGTVTPLFVDDYRVMGTDDQSAVNENVVDKDANPFPNVDDAELNIPQ